jgi:hypothetical protein
MEEWDPPLSSQFRGVMFTGVAKTVKDIVKGA